MTTLYASLAETKKYMNAEDSTDDVTLLGLIRQVSDRIDKMFMPKRRAPVFAPYIETRNNFRLTGDKVNSYAGTYYFGEPLLALSAVSVGSTALTPGTNVAVWQGDLSPYMTLGLSDSCCGSWYRYTNCTGCNGTPFVSIAGTWGYHSDYANAWIDTLQVIPVANLNASAITFTVANVDAPNSLGLTPALSAGNLIQVDTEWMEVVSTDTTTNVVTVRRGVNGSTAAAHTAGAIIYSFQVEEQIKRATYRQAAGEYAKLGAYDESTVQDLSTVTFFADVLAEFNALLTLFANM